MSNKNMKKLILLNILVFLVLAIYAGGPITKKVQYFCSYTRAEDVSAQEFWLTKCCSEKKNNLLKSLGSVAMLAYVYVKNLYGEEVAKGEQPYQIQLVNDSIWCISGNPQKYKKKKWKGNFVIAIDKKSGELLAFMHEK